MLEWHQVMLDDGNHLVDDGALDSDALQKRARHGTARGFMAPGGPAHASFPLAKLSGGGLGEIVAQRGEQQHGAIVALQSLALGDTGRRVHHQHGVRADVAFGMPRRILRNAGERADFREMDDPAGRGQVCGDPAGVAAAGPFHELFGDALARQRAVLAGDGPAHLRGRRVQGQIEAAGKLHPAQHAQRIFAECGAGGAQDAILQIFAASEKIQNLTADGIVGDGVYRKVSPGRRFRGVMDSSKVAWKSRWCGPVLLSRRGMEKSKLRTQASPHRSSCPPGPRGHNGIENRPADRRRSRRLRHRSPLCSRPSSASRTAPPTSRARNPAASRSRRMASSAGGTVRSILESIMVRLGQMARSGFAV